MARKLTATQVAQVLEEASIRRSTDQFILEAVEGKKKAHLRLKGVNGEIVMNQECTDINNARYMAARIIGNGKLLARYKETSI